MTEQVEDSLDYLRDTADFHGLTHICSTVTENADFMEWPASVTKHHIYEGGLVVHTAEVLKGALLLASGSRSADLETIVAAAIFHDFMKIRDYERVPGTLLFQGAPYREGIRHVVGSHAAWVRAAELRCRERAPKWVDAVSHCILAHHGRIEWGSPVEPQTIEAQILHFADMMSARYGEGK